jgi:hypothetical protein
VLLLPKAGRRDDAIFGPIGGVVVVLPPQVVKAIAIA